MALVSIDNSSNLKSSSGCKFMGVIRSRCKKNPKKPSKIAPEECNFDEIWSKIRREAELDAKIEPMLSKYYTSTILAHASLEKALANHLSHKLSNEHLSKTDLCDVFSQLLIQDRAIQRSVRDDLRAIKDCDPAFVTYVHCFLHFKGFLACQAHRLAHSLFNRNRISLALLVQSRVSDVFGVDIHPKAKMGRGIILDHATGIVIGETCTIGNHVTIYHGVTLGGTGKDFGDRHPKIGDRVVIGAGAKVLGNVRIGDGARVGAGSVVLKDVPDHMTAVGNPCRLVGSK